MSELSVDQLIPVSRAIEILDAVAASPKVAFRSINDPAVLGATLAEVVTADRDYPPFDRSLMDGYAVRGLGPAFDVIGDVPAGRSFDKPIAAGQCVSIMTGAPVPADAETVVPIEWTHREGNRVTVEKPIKPGGAIGRRGADVAAGAILLRVGDVVTPAVVATAATVGRVELGVYAKPVVGVLTTGDEVVDAAAAPGPFAIRNASKPMLMALLRRLGCEPVDLGHAIDDPAAIEAAIAGATGEAVLVTGGMSMGTYDYVPRVLKTLGYDFAITKLRIKPGKPLVFATAAEKPMVFGLPGNPVSAYVCTAVLAARVLRRLAGGAAGPEVVAAPLAGNLPPNGPRTFYQPAVLTGGKITLLPWKGSADLFTLAQATHLVERAENEPARRAGTVVEAIVL